jgi:hypothetical protein
MDTARIIQVIETTILRRGKGVEGDPIRIIRQYWAADGTLLAEVDPLVWPSACPYLQTGIKANDRRATMFLDARLRKPGGSHE